MRRPWWSGIRSQSSLLSALSSKVAFSGNFEHRSYMSSMLIVPLARMRSEQVRRLPVVEGETLVGMLSIADVARTQRYDMEAAQALSGITANVCRK